MALLNILHFQARYIRAALVIGGDKATLAVIFVFYNLINMAHVLYYYSKNLHGCSFSLDPLLYAPMVALLFTLNCPSFLKDCLTELMNPLLYDLSLKQSIN